MSADSGEETELSLAQIDRLLGRVEDAAELPDWRAYLAERERAEPVVVMIEPRLAALLQLRYGPELDKTVNGLLRQLVERDGAQPPR